jgi:D-lyxose ketol-isomerase
MLTKQQVEKARQDAISFFDRAGLVLTEKEKLEIEIADFGLSDFEKIGLEVLVYINTKRVCAKEIVMFPGQTCPEHVHVTKNGVPGKEETFRCRWGKVYLYVSGPVNCDKSVVEGLEKYADYLKVAHEVVLEPGEQYTILPDTLHWFRAGDGGAVVSEFSTMSTDAQDVFTDPRINRFTLLAE